MAEFKLEKFKYKWRGDWSASTSYKRDDVVRVSGKSYVCIITHTAELSFRTDLNATLLGSNPPQPQPKWTVMTSGNSFGGEYTTGLDYNLGDIVLYNGVLWLCTVPHTSTSFNVDVVNFQIFANGIDFIGTWTVQTVYSPGAIVSEGGNLYKCIAAHQSSELFELNEVDWEIFLEGVTFKGEWAPLVAYKVNELMKYGGTVFRCTQAHTSGLDEPNNDNFQIEFVGTQYDGDWEEATYYNVGDVVRHRGFVYYSITNNNNSSPYQENGNSDDWILLARNYYFVGDWTLNSEFKTGDIVSRGGNLYLALKDIGANTQDGSSADYLDTDVWELLVSGKKWKKSWASNTYYSTGDVVYYRGSSYTCNFEHLAEANMFPGDNGSGYYYWDILVQAGQQGALNDKGDIITYGANRNLSGVADTSTLGNVAISIGEREQILSVTNEFEAYWRDITVDADAIYVSKNGIDAFNRGTFEKPFRTIRYAAEYIEDNFAALTPTIIRVGTGKFEEIAPIVVPAGCAINGDELRSTTIFASPPKPEYLNDFQYVGAYITHIETILLDILTAVSVTPQVGNTKKQITGSLVPVRDEFGDIVTDLNGNPILISGFPISDLASAGLVTLLFSDYQNYIDYAIGDGSVIPALVGSNVANTTLIETNAADGIMLNAEFIMADVVAFLNNTYPDITFDSNRIESDVYALLRAVKRDILFDGNYATLAAAKRYTSAVLGSKLENLFLMRDSTGLRDCTTGGLEGILNPPGVFELYQKPTGGALVSLDPGWGPDDERTWIKNRSPYIQGVTNTGAGCIGCKIDGALHNGGNRSMTANDFTQVLSDGIGAWVTNNARAELVSVFTYYCQIGYFAEDGGIIRATNGNNSYGKYGAIADGSDDTEIPQAVTVFNRNNEAQISTAFAGGNTDNIFIFEYENAGENYTVADATIVGAGANADVEYTDFRADSMFEARLAQDPDDSAAPGGSNYLARQGSAQETLGASSTIKISTNDTTQDVAEILGMRIIITEGTGVGQYGEISTFNFVNKEVGVISEYDGQPGWDHIIPGTPIQTNLDLTTRYRIEPKLTVSKPQFENITTSSLFANRTYVDLQYAVTREDFNNKSGAAQILWQDDNDTTITVQSIVSAFALQLNASIVQNAATPFNIRGVTSGVNATVTGISANTGSIIEVDIDGNGNSFDPGEDLLLVLISGTGNTFDDDPLGASFNVTRIGLDYTVTLNNPGLGYSTGDTIKIPGTALNASTPANDIIITVGEVTDDSSASIVTFTHTGIGKPNRFIALTNAEYVQYSDNGTLFNELSLPYIGNYQKLLTSEVGKTIALASNTDQLPYTFDAVTWNVSTLPFSANWKDGVYGGGKYVIVADDSNGDLLVSSDATTWTTRSIGDDTGGVDSTISLWSHIDYGKGIYVAVSQNDRATATSTDGGTTWTRHDEVLPDLLGQGQDDWNIVSLVYGDNRFLILDSQGRTAYSFDGINWLSGTTAPQYTQAQYTSMKYGNGIFFALLLDNATATTFASTTEEGLYWEQRTLTNSQQWGAVTFSQLNNTTTWVLLGNAAQSNAIEHVRAGKQAKLRSDVLQGQFSRIKIWDPGSGYISQPIITVTDPNATTEIFPQARLSNGVLGQPDFVNRGNGYRTSTSRINITGDGFADIIPNDSIVTLAGVTSLPGVGVQIRFDGLLNLETELDLTDLKVFSGVKVVDLGDDGSGNGTKLIEVTLAPKLLTEYNIIHNTNVSLLERYSQCRITGHDFLDIGTGNFVETNYPQIYASGNYFVALPENEVYEVNGGRVFYTSSDQDGNFRTGELFSVQQSTGIVTVSAQFFQLDGLSELALGGVRLGGSGTVVNEFSTDPTFVADSNNVIPTQRAIGTFLANRLSVGGENLEVNRLVAGRVSVGGFNNEIESVTSEYVNIPVNVLINGTYTDGDEVVQQTGIQGTIISQMLFAKGFDDLMQ